MRRLRRLPQGPGAHAVPPLTPCASTAHALRFHRSRPALPPLITPPARPQYRARCGATEWNADDVEADLVLATAGTLHSGAETSAAVKAEILLYAQENYDGRDRTTHHTEYGECRNCPIGYYKVSSPSPASFHGLLRESADLRPPSSGLLQGHDAS